MSFARRALSLSCSSGSKTEALRFNETGTVGVDTLRILFAIRVKCGSGSRHKGGAVATCAERQHRSKKLMTLEADQKPGFNLQCILIRPLIPRFLIEQTDVGP